MSLRIVQVPMEEELRQKLDAVAEAERKPRAEIIRKACKEYLRQIQEAELDRQYVEGYRRMPEDPREVEALGLLAAQVWAQEYGEEDWSDWDKEQS